LAIAILAAAAIAAYLAVRTPRARRIVLGVATVAAGVLLSYQHILARRLSVLLFFFSILLTWGVYRTVKSRENRARRCRLGVVVLVLLFFGIKWAGAQRALYGFLHLPDRYLLVLGAWLGASYLIFRLIHLLVEARKPGFPETGFFSIFLYALFPSTLVAGPIDRFHRFHRDETYRQPAFPEAAEGMRRIVVGIFKKFAVADFLGMLPLDFAHAGLSTPRMWVSLYLFGFQVYFDFAGYSDIAIGTAALFGFSIPENFENPFLKENITRFWQSWHATLSNWMRDYVFFPVARSLKKARVALSDDAILLVSFLATMVTIGVWHALQLRLAIWGAWHAGGLFAAKKWGDSRKHLDRTRFLPARRLGATLLTFNFVMLSFVFFYANGVSQSFEIFRLLVGMRR
jgi:D-alanyl-lipoteichoic acid acyltransferase DltB (MBOAT superfamily)